MNIKLDTRPPQTTFGDVAFGAQFVYGGSIWTRTGDGALSADDASAEWNGNSETEVLELVASAPAASFAAGSVVLSQERAEGAGVELWLTSGTPLVTRLTDGYITDGTLFRAVASAGIDITVAAYGTIADPEATDEEE